MRLTAKIVLYGGENYDSCRDGYRGTAEVELTLPNELALKPGFPEQLKAILKNTLDELTLRLK